MGFRPLSTWVLCALELRALNHTDTSWVAFNYYIVCHVKVMTVQLMPVRKSRTSARASELILWYDISVGSSKFSSVVFPPEVQRFEGMLTCPSLSEGARC